MSDAPETVEAAPAHEDASREALIEARGLAKAYGRFRAVDGVDLTLYEGEVYGFLGPNGSGKSTTILMMLGLTEPSGGEIRVCGHDPTRDPIAVKRQVGYLPESVGFYGDLSGAENLRFTAELNAIPRARADARIDELLSIVELADATDQPVAQYSRGMRQRLGLADVLLKDPRVVILDDPTLGLDPAGIQWLLELIGELSRQRNIAFFLSSHQLHEVQRICHRVGIMSHGRLVLEGTLDELTARLDEGGFRVTLVTDGGDGLDDALRAIPGVEGLARAGAQAVISSARDVRAEALATVHERGARLLEMRAQNTSLEEIYLRYFQEAVA